MPNHKPEAVANRFLELAGDKGLTQLQIQKLVYIAHGWTLALCDEPLTNVEPEAWSRGPVYVSLRSRLARFGADRITEAIRLNDNNPSVIMSVTGRGHIFSAKFTNNEESIIKQVWDIYSKFSGFQLSMLTHKKGTAWAQTYSEFDDAKPIADNLTKAHYLELAEKNREKQEGAK